MGETENVPVRDRLALTRTRLANERTMLAYARTAIMLAATGGTLLMLYGDTLMNAASGWTLIVVAIGVAFRGARRYHRLSLALQQLPSLS